MEITHPAVEEYLLRISPRESPILEEMEREALRRRFPIVGPLVGRLLYQLTRLTRARRILELGSGFGYSAFWFASALEEGAELVLTEFSAENLERARAYFGRADLRCQIHFHQGDALEFLEAVEGSFDIIFNDVVKADYPRVFRLAGPRVREGGLLLSDNVLWHGKVVEEEPDEDTRAIQEYARLMFASPEFFSSILPVRDGISISLRRPRRQASLLLERSRNS